MGLLTRKVINSKLIPTHVRPCLFISLHIVSPFHEPYQPIDSISEARPYVRILLLA